MQVPYTVHRKQTYTVQIPYQEEVVDDDGEKIMVTRTRAEERSRMVPMTRLRTEKRTRKIARPIDKSIAQASNTTVATSATDSPKPPIARLKLAIDDLEFFSPRGEKVNPVIAAKQLRLRQPVVFLRKDETISTYFLQLLRPETLVVQRRETKDSDTF